MGTKIVPARDYERMKNLLRPTAIATSLWASSKILLVLQVAKIKDFLNIKTDEANVNSKPPTSFISSSRLGNHDQDYQTGSKVEAASESKSGKSVPAEGPLPERASSNPSNALPPLPPIPKPGEDISLAYNMFSRTLAKTWKRPSIPAERGVVMVSGLVQVEGSKAVCVMDVMAYYHPQETRWVGISMAIRRMQSRKQVPKGGR